ncbi:TetR/AcrR family transcriptional regulator [Actinoplanes sp. ATCC 53533]|uniref:TetR/AcrR family transcriptional regulator n=1 Tax=Actinoplanes sp. ATCC 53533 TaxID=1288362 RepID=UPI000F79E464|nr:TetR family transcriptional regulator [Actinoplanes sp. ATCC 53533]RSM67942.1 TetR/AcrR family transcriptional regulator [Actinoplanes sp. ATCC 53533]
MTVGRPRTVSDEQILAGAARVVARMGPARLTLAEVGQEVGLAAATLTQRFKTKRGLLLALARHGADALPDRLAAARSAAAPARALIENFAALAGSVRTSAEFANHLAFLLLDLTDPQFQQISRDYADAVEQTIAEVLAAAHAAGEIVHTDLTDLPRAIHAAYNGAMVTWGMHGQGSPADQVRTQLTILLEPYLGSED